MSTAKEQTPEQKLRSNVKFHEFLLTGGVVIGTNERGNTVYSPPVVVSETPTCPWHDENCEAWIELREGRGTGEIVSPNLNELRNLTDEQLAANRAAKAAYKPTSAEAAAIKKVQEAKKHGPSRALRRANDSVDDKTVLCDDHFAEEKYQMAASMLAGKDTDPDTWHIIPRSRFGCIVGDCDAGHEVLTPEPYRFPNGKTTDDLIRESQERTPPTGGYGGDPWNRPPTGYSSPYGQYESVPKPRRFAPPPPPDTRDDAVAEFASMSIDDEIIIEGNEEDDDE